MNNGGIVHIDAASLAEVLEFGSVEGGAQVCDDPIVDGDEYVGVAALRCFQGSHRIESPASEWPGWRDRSQSLSRNVLLL